MLVQYMVSSLWKQVSGHSQILFFNTFITFLYMFRALCAHLQEDRIILVQHLVSSMSSGDCSVHRLRQDSSIVLLYYIILYCVI